ncbi:MAG: DUF3631 domain-containing protein [Methylocystis sp.]
MDILSYERERAAAAHRLGVRTSALDAEVARLRAQLSAKSAEGLCADVEPWPEPVEVHELLGEVRSMIRRFIICEPETRTATTLWIAFTWVIDHVQVAPLAIITAPEKGCGKTQLLEVIGKLSRRNLFASNISPAATFRVIEARSPTLLIDEADSFFRENEELRGVINSGHTRTSAYVIRTVGDDHEPRQFSTWGAKAIAGIGRLPETVMSRGVVLQLRRKMKTERVERLRHAEAGLFETLARKLARFGADHGAAIGRAKPVLPDALGDRTQDNWEPLLAIADIAGGSWPEDARRAALALNAGEAELSVGEQLLQAIRDAFDQDCAGKLARDELMRRLTADEEAPWATWNKGKPMTAEQLRKRLKPYAIATKKVRLSSYQTAQGFERSQFDDAWRRYLDAPGAPSQKWNTGTVSESPRFERSEPVPFADAEWNAGTQTGHGDGSPIINPVPSQSEHRNAVGTLKAPENKGCSIVPPAPPVEGRKVVRL